MNLFILASRNYIDIVSKDFAMDYQHSLKVYQNDIGFYEHARKALNSNGDYRVYLKYNNISKDGDKYFLKTSIQPIPIKFTMSSDNSERLQKAFNMVKGITLQRIYRNNYTKHCINKVHIEGEELVDTNEGEANISICVVMLEHEKDVSTLCNFLAK
jgi:hypothetical protein